jgi:hypothetical protein
VIHPWPGGDIENDFYNAIPIRHTTEADIKAMVRERDGSKCLACGMTVEQHVEKFGETLHVHRVIPGTTYADDWCVTLCQPCHGKRPKRTKDAFWCADVRWFGLVLLWERERYVWERVKEIAATAGQDPSVIVLRILEHYLKDMPPDYCI